jgi:hypothetical protein
VNLIGLPFSTFGAIAAAGWRTRVYCPDCYRWKEIAVTDALRDRLPFHAPFRCKNIRPITRTLCDRIGHVQIEPIALRSPRVQMCRVSCGYDLRPWSIEGILLGESPWPRITNQDRFRCPACQGETGLGFYGGPHTPNPGPFHQGQQYR